MCRERKSVVREKGRLTTILRSSMRASFVLVRDTDTDCIRLTKKAQLVIIDFLDYIYKKRVKYSAPTF